ncbi:uncharacterized protein [Anolis sagrei]|uniref:uncharacterized protein n=1 Tax=Anolis sagrei TaxID=38937 RepID=UPI00351FA0D8
MARKSDDTGLPDVEYFTFKHDYRFLQLLSLDPNFNIEEKLKKFGRTKAEDEEFLYLIRPYLRRPDRDIAQRMRLAFYPDMRKEPGWEPNIKPTRIPVSKRPTLLYRNPEDKPTKSKPAPEPEVKEERIIPPQSQWHFPPIVTKADIKELENKKLEVMCNIYTQEARMQIRREKLAAEIGIDLKKLPPVTAPGPSREQEKAVRKTQEVGGEESRKGRSKTVQWKVKQDKEITQEKTSKNQSWSRGKYHENGNGSKRKTEEVKILTQPWPTWVAAEKTLISSSANPAAVQGRLASEPPQSVENGRLSGDVRGRGSAISRCLASGGTCRSTDRETKLILKTTEAKGKQRAAGGARQSGAYGMASWCPAVTQSASEICDRTYDEMARKSDDTGLPDVEYFTFKHDYRFLQLLSLDPNFNIEEKLKKFGRTKAEDEEFLS